MCVGSFVAAAHTRQTPAAPTVRVTSSSPAAEPAMTQDRYLELVRAAGAGTTIAGRTDAELIASGKSLCSDLDHGATAATFAQQVYQYGIDAWVFKRLLSAAVYAYCPNHADVL